jgi:hypothetical protein
MAVVTVVAPAEPASASRSQIIQPVQVIAISPDDSALYKSVSVSCPAGMRVVGAGFQLLGAAGHIVLDDLIPSATGVQVGAGKDQYGTTDNWQIVAVAACAVAPVGIEIVSDTSAFAPGGGRDAAAACPLGRRVIGTGASLSNGWGEISINSVEVHNAAVFAHGTQDQDGYSGSWAITVYAICASPVVGLNISTGISTDDSSSPKRAVAECPDQRALGLGWSVGDSGQAYITQAIIDANQIIATASEDADSYDGTWRLVATATCASR